MKITTKQLPFLEALNTLIARGVESELIFRLDDHDKCIIATDEHAPFVGNPAAHRIYGVRCEDRAIYEGVWWIERGMLTYRWSHQNAVTTRFMPKAELMNASALKRMQKRLMAKLGQSR
jgi:hypothetical protein